MCWPVRRTASQLSQGLDTLSELAVFFELYIPKPADDMFHGSGGSTRAGWVGMNGIEPSAPPKESPADSGGENGECSDDCDNGPNDPKSLGRGGWNASRPYELNGFAPNGARRSDSAGHNDPSLEPNVRAGGAWKACAADGVFSLDDVRSSSSSWPRMSFNESERESVDDRSLREELGPAVGAI